MPIWNFILIFYIFLAINFSCVIQVQQTGSPLLLQIILKCFEIFLKCSDLIPTIRESTVWRFKGLKPKQIYQDYPLSLSNFSSSNLGASNLSSSHLSSSHFCTWIQVPWDFLRIELQETSTNMKIAWFTQISRYVRIRASFFRPFRKSWDSGNTKNHFQGIPIPGFISTPKKS